MGIILGPFVLLWLGASFYSLWIGYELLSSAERYPYAVQVLGTAVSLMLLYVYFGLSRFKRHHHLWAFEIHMYFNLNIPAALVFLSALLVHLFGVGYIESEYFKVVPFMLMFITSLGTIVGTFSADSYMERNNIVKTY